MRFCRVALLRFSITLTLSLIVLTFTGCGGGGSSPTSPTTPAAVTVSVTPGTATVTIPTPQTFVATVANATNTAVTWSVDEGASGGSIDSSGVYTPPNQTGTFHVTAKSQADSTKTGTATVTVAAPAPVISSTPPTAAANGIAYTYTATATDPASSGITLSLTSAPAGASISGNIVTWTPSDAQSRTSNDFTLKAATGLGKSATQSWSVTPTGDVTVSGFVNNYTEAGVEQVPIIPNQVIAQVPASGGYTKVTSTLNGNTATFTNLQPGPYLLSRYGDNTFDAWTSANHYDISYNSIGRPDRNVGNQIATFNLSGLTPTTPNDRVDIFSFNAFAHFNVTPFTLTAPGSTTALFGTNWQIQGLADASKGDKVYLNQMSAQTINGETIAVVSASTGALSVTQTLAGDHFTWSLTPVGLNSILRANVKGAAFESLTSKMGPGAVSQGGNFYLDAEPVLNYTGIYSPKLVQYAGTPITTDKDFGDIAYGNPFPNTWTPGFYYEHTAFVNYQAPGATALDQRVKSVVFTTTLPTQNAPAQPLVGPVENPKINNLPLTTAQTGVGLQPTISWTAPLVGTADYYQVLIGEITIYQGKTRILWWTLYVATRSTSLQIPAGVLEAGKSYAVKITALNQPGFDIEKGGAALVPQLAYTEFSSAQIQP